AIQTTRAHDLDALCTQTHGILHGTLHRAAEHDALFELLRNRVGDQLRVDFRFAHFLDIDVHRHAHDRLQLTLERLDVLTFLADDDTRTSTEQRDTRVLGRALNDDTAHRSMRQTLLQEATHLDI